MKFVFLYYYYDEKIKSKMRTEFPPLGMLYVCSVVKELGHEVEVFYFDMDTKIEEFPSADVYAYSISSTASYPVYRYKASYLKNKAKKFIAGNTHASIFPETVLAELNLDAVFVGEGEISIANWINSGMKQRGGIKSKRNTDLRLPFPARELIPDEKIYMSGRVGGKSKYSVSMISSRGCVYQCAFCAIQNRGRVFFRELDDFNEEIRSIMQRYPLCDGITLLDETFTLKEDHAIGITEIFSKEGLPFECNSRADTISDNLIDALAESSCREIRIGLETGSPQLLKAMRKGIDLDATIQVLKKLHNRMVPVKLYLMHGFPGENKQTTMETIRYLQRIREYVDRISLYRFTPLPGSPVFHTLNVSGRKWQDFTIYDNDVWWWGDIEDYKEMREAYYLLENEVKMFEKGKL